MISFTMRSRIAFRRATRPRCASRGTNPDRRRTRRAPRFRNEGGRRSVEQRPSRSSTLLQSRMRNERGCSTTQLSLQPATHSLLRLAAARANDAERRWIGRQIMEEVMYPSATRELARKRRELAPETKAAFQAFSQRVFADGALPGKVKQLIAVAVAHVTSTAVCNSVSALTSAPTRTTTTENQIHVMKPTIAPSDP